MPNSPLKSLQSTFHPSSLASFLGKKRTIPDAGQDFFPVPASSGDIVVFSLLRWDLAFRRPQPLFRRFSRGHRVFYIEEPRFDSTHSYMQVSVHERGLHVVTPHLSARLTESQIYFQLKVLIDNFFQEHQMKDYVLWYYSPMALPFSRHLYPKTIVYDCTEEFSVTSSAHPHLIKYERELLSRAELVFTDGLSLYNHKKEKHFNIHPFPSPIDAGHFYPARAGLRDREPADQASLRGIKIGFSGVIDDRIDLSLLADLAQARPTWNFILLGPILKIDPWKLPQCANLHYLGAKTYAELPAYFAGWDAAIIPFVQSPTTRYISPTKTAAYLAAGKPVVSTPIAEVTDLYQEDALVATADTAVDFIAELELLLSRTESSWLNRVDPFLANHSWDKTWFRMNTLLEKAIYETNQIASPAPLEMDLGFSFGALHQVRSIGPDCFDY